MRAFIHEVLTYVGITQMLCFAYVIFTLISRYGVLGVYWNFVAPSANVPLWDSCPEAYYFFFAINPVLSGALAALYFVLRYGPDEPSRWHFSAATLLIGAGSPDFFSRALFSPLSSQHLQTYYSLSVYFFLAFALCGLLAGLAYLFSISTAQETEKRSEYECGFAPFDSATRLPFDVHFYLVGILFLIFDVEVALLFPWVLALRTTGWFSFYLMLAFLAILSLGFLYEWKRGALIWPTRYSKKNFSPLAWLIAAAQGETAHELFDILTNWPGLLFVNIFLLHRLALVYEFVKKSKRDSRDKAIRVLWFVAAVIFFISLFYSYWLSLALASVFFVSSYLESNLFWPARAYWWARVLLFSFPSRFETRPYQALRRIWGFVLFLFILWAATFAYSFFVPFAFIKPPKYNMLMVNEFYYTSVSETFWHRGWNYTFYLFQWGAEALAFLLTLSAIHVLGTPFVTFAKLIDITQNYLSIYNIFAALLVFWMVAATTASYAYGGTSFIVGSNLYVKRAGDLSIVENMRYLWTELLFLVAVAALAFFFYLVDWDLVASVGNAIIASERLGFITFCEEVVASILSAPADTLALLTRVRLYIISAVTAVLVFFAQILADLALLLPLVWRFKLAILWGLYAIRGYYYTTYLHQDEAASFYGKFVLILSSLLYTYVMPFVNLYHFSSKTFSQVIDKVTSYYVKYKGTNPKEDRTLLTSGTAGATPASKAVLGAVVVVDRMGAPTGLDPETVLQILRPVQEDMYALMNDVVSAQIVYQDLDNVVSMLAFTALCLFARSIQLTIRWLTRKPLPAYASPELVKQFAWAPRKASLVAAVFPKVEPENDTYVYIDFLDKFIESIDDLFVMRALANAKIYDAYITIASLSFCCVALFVANCILSRMCQHHYQQLNGILTYGALVVVTEPKASTRASKATTLPFMLSAGDLLPNIQVEFTEEQLVGFPLVAEALLFLLICGVITKLSFALGRDHNKRQLAFYSWKLLSAGLFSVMFIYAYQFMFDSGSATILNGYFATSRTITFLKLITLLSAVFVLDASETFMRQHSRHLLEYPIMVALTTLFMLLLVSANHVMSTFLALVGFSLGLYVLILYDANKRPSREAGLKYYYLSTLSSGFILYGILLIYTLTGTGNFDELFLLFNTKLQFQENTLLRTALLLILAGFFFKLSAFPGHLWAADVYEGSPAPVTAFFMLPVKVVVLGAFIRLFSIALAPLAPYWLPLLTLAVIISIVWGAFASVQEKKIRRFLAYASINQMGFLLMGFTTDSDEGYQAALLYIAVYAVMTCAFLTIFLSARRQDGSELLYVSDFRTLASRNWLVGWSLAVVLFSMAGIPPLGGFFAKYLVLLHAFEKNLIAEVVVGLATSLISTYYYLRIIKILKFEQPDGAMPAAPCLTSRRQNQLFASEALLWTFILFAPATLGLTYTLSFTQGPACVIF